MKVYTSNYENCPGSHGFSISLDGGKSVGFEGPQIPELVPKEEWYQAWHDIIGKISENENLRFLVESYYETVLKELDPGDILCKLREGDIIFCNGEPHELSCRQIIGIWLELFFGIDVREVKILEDGTKKILPRNKYYSVIRGMLETLIKDNINMHGYTAICAAYAYEQAISVADKPEICRKFGVSSEMYLSLAEVLENMHGEKAKSKK